MSFFIRSVVRNQCLRVSVEVKCVCFGEPNIDPCKQIKLGNSDRFFYTDVEQFQSIMEHGSNGD